MGLSASQGRLLLLTARRSDLEFRAQQISQKRLNLSQQLEQISMEYETATSDRQMKIFVYRSDVPEGQENEYNTQHTNLTYASLISGTLRNIRNFVNIRYNDSTIWSNQTIRSCTYIISRVIIRLNTGIF